MKLKRLLAILLVFCLLPVYAYAEASESKFMLKIGSSSYAIPVDNTFFSGELTDEDLENCMIDCYYNEESPVEFYVYEWINEFEGSFYDYVVYEADMYYVTDVSEKPIITIDNTDIYYYETSEEFDGDEFLTLNYLFEENGEAYALEFWIEADNDKQLKQVKSMMDGIEKVELTQIANSSFYFYAPGYIKEDVTDKEIADIIEYYYNENSDLDFDVYQWANEGDTLEDYAVFEAGDNELTVIEGPDSDIYMYFAEEEFDGETYFTINCLFEDGDDFVEVVFWPYSDSGFDEALRIFASIEKR